METPCQPDSLEDYNEWCLNAGIENLYSGTKNLSSLMSYDPGSEMMNSFFDLLKRKLRKIADPDMALNNLERYFRASRSPRTLLTLCVVSSTALSTLLEIFSASHFLSDLLIAEPELFDSVQESGPQTLLTHKLLDELLSEVMSLEKDTAILRALRRFKRRYLLRIAYGDLIQKQPIEIVTQQISSLADVVVEVALRLAGRTLFHKRGTPRSRQGAMAHFSVIALGKLGGNELNYSSDIDLMFLYDNEGMVDSSAIHNSEYFSELGREIVRLLSESTDAGFAYRVDMRLRPYGQRGVLVTSFDDAVRYYDNHGRTWERQAFIKARHIAGSTELSHNFLKRIEPWVYRRYLTQMDIVGIQSLKRRIENNAPSQDGNLINVKTGRGGIRDIEFVTQFLQLLHGGELPELRTGNTLTAINHLEQTGCLDRQERDLLCENYCLLRKIEHRLQIAFDLQTHEIPTQPEERRKLAYRIGYSDDESHHVTALEAFNADLSLITNENQKILDHILVKAFPWKAEEAAEIDLFLDPEPTMERIESVLEKYRFTDPIKIYRLMLDLAYERNPYFSGRRCIRFLVAISPALLKAVSQTPAPERTLTTLAAVGDALGEKSGLWELFSFNPPSLQLFVRLCAYAPYLTDMIKRDPGILDALMDTLVLNKIPPREHMDEALDRLCLNATSLEPILAAFKNDMTLAIGAYDILHKSGVRETVTFLSDVAQCILKQVVMDVFHNLVKRHGIPIVRTDVDGRDTGEESEIIKSAKRSSPNDDNPVSTQQNSLETNFKRLLEQLPASLRPCRFAIVAIGKFGGREMNYHSDLDLFFIYENDGSTCFLDWNAVIGSTTASFDTPPPNEPLQNQIFFSTLMQKTVKRMTQSGSWGKLYDIDLRLRPFGKSGLLAISLDGFLRYFREGTGEIWERQMLGKARVVFSSDQLFDDVSATSPPSEDRNRPFHQCVMEMIRKAQTSRPLDVDWLDQIETMRKKMSLASPEDQLKRGEGGTVDIEFIVQILQIKYGQTRPGISVPNTIDALENLHAAGIIDEDDYSQYHQGYRLFRKIESCLALMNMPSTSKLPTESQQLDILAGLTGFKSGQELRERVNQTLKKLAVSFQRLINAARA